MLSDQQQHCFDCVKYGTHGKFIVFNGGAGTGKSFAIDEIREKIPNVLLACPTAKAASIIKANTIHGVFGAPVGVLDPDIPAPRLRYADRVTRYFKGADVLRACSWIIFDEYSMIRCDLFDFCDRALRSARKNDTPFGGCGVLLSGDDGQLPSVVTDSDFKELKAYGYESPFSVREAKVWKEL